MEIRLCQGCAHRAHPQGLTLIESGLHATRSIVPLRAFYKMHPALPYREKFLPKNSSGLARQDAHKDYLEPYRKTTGFYL
jgi:hypothetical protein